MIRRVGSLAEILRGGRLGQDGKARAKHRPDEDQKSGKKNSKKVRLFYMRDVVAKVASPRGVSAVVSGTQQATGKKMWFWFDDDAIGADIESPHQAAIVTEVNQALLRSGVWVEDELFSSDDAVTVATDWVWQDEVGYLFPDRPNL